MCKSSWTYHNISKNSLQTTSWRFEFFMKSMESMERFRKDSLLTAFQNILTRSSQRYLKMFSLISLQCLEKHFHEQRNSIYIFLYQEMICNISSKSFKDLLHDLTCKDPFCV